MGKLIWCQSIKSAQSESAPYADIIKKDTNYHHSCIHSQCRLFNKISGLIIVKLSLAINCYVECSITSKTTCVLGP